MKRRFTIITIIISSTVLFGCMKVDDSTVNNNTDKSNASQAVDNKSEENTNTDKSDNGKTITNNDDNKSQEKVSLLKEMKEQAKIGKVIKCKFKAKDNILDDVRVELGKEDKLDYVEAAKGSYATYTKEGVVFGVNKGEAIFEVRSYDEDIKDISLKDIKDILGIPQYDVITDNNERIVGYIVNDDFKIEFVLRNINESETSQTIDHYGVFYPKGTVNLMADDPGREW